MSASQKVKQYAERWQAQKVVDISELNESMALAKAGKLEPQVFRMVAEVAGYVSQNRSAARDLRSKRVYDIEDDEWGFIMAPEEICHSGE